MSKECQRCGLYNDGITCNGQAVYDPAECPVERLVPSKIRRRR